MKLLLDTHIWIWTVLEPWRVSSEVTQEIARAEAVYLSPISIWELSLLAEKKTVVLHMDFAKWCQQAIREQALKEAPLTWEVAAEMPFTRFMHRDPGDRFLVATAKVYDLTLVTADERLIAAPGVKVLANH